MDHSQKQGNGLVTIFAAGVIDDRRNSWDETSPGAWGAALIWGNHTREICDFEKQTTRYRMELTAVARPLECLTRPSHVKVWLGDEDEDSDGDGALFIGNHLQKLKSIGEQALGDMTEEEIGLWHRLAAMEELHTIEWGDASMEDFELNQHPVRHRSFALAHSRLKQGKKEVKEKSIDTAMDQYIEARRAECSERKIDEIGGVLGSLSWSIDYRSEGKSAEIPAEETLDHIRPFLSDLVHKMIISTNHMKEVRRVLPDFLEWLQAQGRLDADSVKSAIANAKSELREIISIRKFVDALSSYVDGISRAYDGPRRSAAISDEYLEIRDISGDTITFTGTFLGDEALRNRPVGPIKIPAEIAKLGKPGWAILLSATCIDGEWQLIDVSNGDIYLFC